MDRLVYTAPASRIHPGAFEKSFLVSGLVDMPNTPIYPVEDLDGDN